MVNMCELRKITEVPFPYSQLLGHSLVKNIAVCWDQVKNRSMSNGFSNSSIVILRFLSYMMVLQWLASPVVASQLISKWWWAGAAIWLLSTSYWTLRLALKITLERMEMWDGSNLWYVHIYCNHNVYIYNHMNGGISIQKQVILGYLGQGFDTLPI